MRPLALLLLPLLLMAAGCQGCHPAAPPPEEPLAADTVQSLREALQNLAYASDYVAEGHVQLDDGVSDAGGGTAALDSAYAEGDLDGDAQPEAVAVLATSAGGSGTFFDLVVVQRRGGRLVHAASAPLGDRVEVRQITIDEGGRIRVQLLAHAPYDPFCCPSLDTTLTFTFAGGRLVQE